MTHGSSSSASPPLYSDTKRHPTRSLICAGYCRNRLLKTSPVIRNMLYWPCGRTPAREADERCDNMRILVCMRTLLSSCAEIIETVAHSIRWPRGRASQRAVPVSPAYFCPRRAKRHSVHYDTTSVSHVSFFVVAESTRTSKSRRERLKRLCHTC